MVDKKNLNTVIVQIILDPTVLASKERHADRGWMDGWMDGLNCEAPEH